MGAFDKFRTADPMGVRKYIEAGQHRFLVKRTVQRVTNNPNAKKNGMEITVVELKVVRSDTLKIGEVCSLVETEAQQGYAGNVLSFVAGILGYTIDEMKADPDFDEVFEGVFGPQQILTDMLVDCVAQQVKTVKGGDYTAKSWEPVPASAYAEDNLIAPEGAYGSEDAAGVGDGAAGGDAGAGAAA